MSEVDDDLPATATHRGDSLFRRVVFIGLLGASSYMTWFGLSLLYGGGASNDSGGLGLAGYALPVVLAIAFHALIVRALQRWRASRRWSHFIFGVLSLQLTVIAVSYGAHWTHMNAGAEGRGRYAAAQQNVERGLLVWMQGFAAFDAELGALADYSQKQADIEAHTGKSCGVQVRTGEGERFELRMGDKTAFLALREDGKARLATRQALVDTVRKLAAAEGDDIAQKLPALREIVNQARAMETDPFVEQSRKTIIDRLALGRAPIPIPLSHRVPHGPTAFTCPDAELERRMNAVIAAIGSLRPIAEADVVDTRDAHNDYAIAARRLVNAVRSFLGAHVDETTGALDPWRDVGPLLSACALEAMIVLLFRSVGESLPTHGGIEALAEAMRRRHRRTLDQIWSALGGVSRERVVRCLYRHTAFAGGRMLVLAPVSPDDEESLVLHQVMEMLTFAGLARRSAYSGAGGLRLWAITHRWRSEDRTRLRGARGLPIYAISRGNFLAVVLDGLGEDVSNTPIPERLRSRLLDAA